MIRHLILVVVSALPLLMVAILAGAAHGPGAMLAGVLLWLVGVAILATTVWRETVEPLERLLGGLGARTGHAALWKVRELHEDLEACRTEREASRELLADLSAGLADGLLVVDRKLKVRLINPEGLRFCGVEEVQPGTSLLKVLRDPEILEAVEHGARGGRPGPILHENPRGVWEVRVSPVGRGGAVVLLAEVSLIRRSAELRRRFVQDLSHEIRSPLAVLRTTVEALEEEVDPAAADLLVRQVERITRLSEELQELAEIESGELELVPEMLRLAEVTGEAVADARGNALRARVTVEERVPPNLELVTDRRCLLRVLANLLDNAVKYNRPGGRVELRARGEDGWVVLEVEDTGRGIPPDEVRAVFQRFYRVERGRTPGRGGLGLGLAIVKHLVQRLGGRLELHSREGVGTTVTVRLPTNAAQGP
ncbi:MAG TPA: hypothetical protein ENK19_10605 [Acidobacteria bacterium]|nr:hypothetical protein [Acidobacteriota bacterium]